MRSVVWPYVACFFVGSTISLAVIEARGDEPCTARPSSAVGGMGMPGKTGSSANPSESKSVQGFGIERNREEEVQDEQ